MYQIACDLMNSNGKNVFELEMWFSIAVFVQQKIVTIEKLDGFIIAEDVSNMQIFFHLGYIFIQYSKWKLITIRWLAVLSFSNLFEDSDVINHKLIGFNYATAMDRSVHFHAGCKKPSVWLLSWCLWDFLWVVLSRGKVLTVFAVHSYGKNGKDLIQR